ncbi:MAG: hypothetical protein CL840_14590 [Crocinitomicaceae bacterium]|nr:hypothetical protein [Crocinitomicaceae bacterium]
MIRPIFLTRVFLVLVTLLVAFSLFSQEQQGHLMLRVFPYDAIVKVDGKPYSKRGRAGFIYLDLKPGTHVIQAWAPTYNLFEKEVVINAGDTIQITKSLSFTEEYIAYKKEKRLQTIAKVSLIAIPSLATVGFTAAFYSKKTAEENKVHEAKVQVEVDRVKYENSISKDNIRITKAELNESLNAYDVAVDNYNKFVTNSMIKIGVSAGLTAVAVWTVSKFKKIEYKEDVLLSRLQLQLNPIDNELGLVWRFSK